MSRKRVTLTSGAYQARSLIASAQRCVNLYPEAAPAETDEPSPVTHYQTPGLVLRATPPVVRGGRGMYRATTGNLYAVIGRTVYYVSPIYELVALGQVADLATPVSMIDNGIVLIIVDGTANGYVVDIVNGNKFGVINDPAFYGANKVDYVDTFFVFNKPGSAIYYISLSLASFGMLTGTAIATGTAGGTILGTAITAGTIAGDGATSGAISAAGSGYANGTYLNVPLTAVTGVGTGALATITCAAGVVSAVTITSAGSKYAAGDQLTATPGGGTNFRYTLTAPAAGGSNYTAGTYTAIPLSGGSGTGAVATIVVGSGGAVTSVTLTNKGTGYAVGDVLSAQAASIGNGSGFIYRVTATASGGVGYTDGQYNVVPLRGGTGSGATANIQITGGAVVSVDVAANGTGYTKGDVLTVNAADVGGTGQGFGFKFTTSAPAFDALDFAQKAGGPDPLVSLICVHREIWLIGTLAAEVAVNTGAPDFTFGPLAGAYMEAGTNAPNSLARHSLSVFFLAQDRQGQSIVVQSEGYVINRVSTYALEAEMQTYAITSDAIGFTYQLNGHQFYALTFPSQDVTWVYDIGTAQWHQWAYADANGTLHRHRAGAYAFAYGENLICDWQSGSIYALDSETFTDHGDPIQRLRSFPHLMDDGARVTYSKFIADVAVGNQDKSATPRDVALEVVKGKDGKAAINILRRGSLPYVQLQPLDLAGKTVIRLRYSDDRGATFSGSIDQSMGAEGEYATSVEWGQLGVARDRVFEISWSADVKCALNGAFIDTVKHDT